MVTSPFALSVPAVVAAADGDRARFVDREQPAAGGQRAAGGGWRRC